MANSQSKTFMVALGINQDGYKEILGFGLYEQDAESTWSEFLERLKVRGLKDVDLGTSDAYVRLRTLPRIVSIRPPGSDASSTLSETSWTR